MSAALAMAVFSGAVAQDKQGKTGMTMEQRAEKQTEAMANRLQLSAEQKKKVYELNLQTMKDMHTNRSDRAHLRDAHKAKEEKLRAILTPEQNAKMDEMRGARKK